MRKLLLATTAVVATAFIAPTAMAQDPAGMVMPTRMAGANTNALGVRLGGFFEFRTYSINDDNDRNAVTNAAGNRRFGRQPVDFQNELELNVFIDGKASNGMTYGAVFEFQMDGNQTLTANAVNMDEAYAFISHPTFGTVRFGAEDSAASIMQVRAPTIQGTSVSDFFDEAFIRQSSITGMNDGNDATKIIYLSPQFFGFDFGLSYAPNPGEGEGQGETGGTAPAGVFTRDRDRLNQRNEVTAALRYRGVFGPVGLSLSAVGQQIDSNARYGGAPNVAGGQLRSRITAYSAGAQVAAYGFTIGGEYTFGDYRVSNAGNQATGRVAQDRGDDATTQFVIGVTYNVPGTPLALGAFYGRVDSDINGTGPKYRQEGYGFGLAYTLAPGLVTYASYGHLRDTNSRTVDQNLAAGGFQTTRNAESYSAGFRLAF